ncbi:MAG TPA: protealysin inhibitor emfourin [Nocardioidaceae bacterium]|nr:protealysin inhibitor emfourin [Nocardioidaceae bacterium]
MRHLLALVACTVVIGIAGCGAAAPDQEPPSGRTTAAEQTTGTDDPTASADGPVTVRVRVSGGIAGIERRYVVDTSQPPQRLSEAKRDRVAELAGSEAVRSFAGSHVEPGECCDLMEYRVVIEHADGSTTRIVTNDADNPPQAYAQLLSIITQVR